MHAYYAQEERCIMIVLWWYDEPFGKKTLPYSGNCDAICGIFNTDHNDIALRCWKDM